MLYVKNLLSFIPNVFLLLFPVGWVYISIAPFQQNGKTIVKIGMSHSAKISSITSISGTNNNKWKLGNIMLAWRVVFPWGFISSILGIGLEQLLITYLSNGAGISSFQGRETYIGYDDDIIDRVIAIIDELERYQRTGVFFSNRPGIIANDKAATSWWLAPIALFMMSFHANDTTFLSPEHNNLALIKPVADKGYVSWALGATNTRVGTTSLSGHTHTLTDLLEHLKSSLELHPGNMCDARLEFDDPVLEQWLSMQGSDGVKEEPKSTDFLRQPELPRPDQHEPFHEKPAFVAAACWIALVALYVRLLWYTPVIIAGMEFRILYIVIIIFYVYNFIKKM